MDATAVTTQKSSQGRPIVLPVPEISSIIQLTTKISIRERKKDYHLS